MIEPYESVLDAARAGAGWAFERLHASLSPAVHGYLRLQGADDPEGLTNEVFLGVFRGLPTFEGDTEAFRTWVFSIAYRRMVDERRRRGRRVTEAPLENAPEGAGGDTEQEVLAALDEEQIHRLLDGLAPDQRDVLLLRVVGDQTVEQVAAALGKRPGAVKALQRRGLEALRRNISRQGVPL